MDASIIGAVTKYSASKSKPRFDKVFRKKSAMEMKKEEKVKKSLGL